MADAEPVRRAREPPIGNQRDLLADTLADQRAGGLQHLAHARPAFRTLIADDDHVADLVVAALYRGERILLAIKAARRAGELQPLHAGDLHDRPLRRQVAPEHHHAAGWREGVRGRTDHVLLLGEDGLLQILGNGLAGDGDAVAVEIAAIEQSLYQHRHAADLLKVFHHVFAARLEIADIGRAGEDFSHFVQV